MKPDIAAPGRAFSALSSSAFTINTPPVVQVLDPDESGGADWATEVKGNPWDMSGATDIMLAYNATGGTYTTDAGRTVYRATSAASGGSTGDPSVFLVTNGALLTGWRLPSTRRGTTGSRSA